MVLSWKPTSLLISTCCKKSLPVCIFFSAVAVHSDSVHSVQCSCVLHLRLLCASVHTRSLPVSVHTRPPPPSVHTVGALCACVHTGSSSGVHTRPSSPLRQWTRALVRSRCSMLLPLLVISWLQPLLPKFALEIRKPGCFYCRAERKLTFSQLWHWPNTLHLAKDSQQKDVLQYVKFAFLHLQKMENMWHRRQCWDILTFAKKDNLVEKR